MNRILSVVALLAILAVAPAGPVQPVAAAPQVTIEASQWEAVPAGSWSAFTVRLFNASTENFEGTLRVAPVNSPVPGATSAERSGAATYERPVHVPAGARGTTFVVLPAGDPGFHRAELLDQSGRPLATGQPQATGPVPPQSPVPRIRIAVVSDNPAASTQMLSAGAAAAFSERFQSPASLPGDATWFQGLDAVVIADADTSRLRPQQVDALAAYVALGGGLVVGGGSAATRTVTSLPPELAPLRPSRTVTASLSPLADLAGATTSATATVADGDVQGGRVVLTGSEGLPLMVEGRHGAGRILQLAFDPLAEFPKLLSPTGGVRPWEAVLRRIVPAASLRPADPDSEAVPWSEVRASVPRPRASSPLAGLALVVYAAVAGPVAFWIVRRRGRPALLWTTVPALAVGAAALCWATSAVGAKVARAEVLLQRTATGVVRTETYREIEARGRADRRTLSLPAGSVLSTSAPPPTSHALPSPFPTTKGPEADPLITVAPARPTVARMHGLRPWQALQLVTVLVTHEPAGIDASLRVAEGRLSGRITNRGPIALLSAEVRAGDGNQASLATVLPPGVPVDVDVAYGPGGGSSATLTDRAAHGRALLPGQLDIVATARTGAVASLATLESADDFVAGFGRARPVYLATADADVNVFELDVPPGLDRPMLLHSGSPLARTDVYDWTARTWRPIGEERAVEAALMSGETKNGLVRVRLRGSGARAEGLVLRVAP